MPSGIYFPFMALSQSNILNFYSLQLMLVYYELVDERFLMEMTSDHVFVCNKKKNYI